MKKFYIAATISLMYLGLSQGAMALPLIPSIPDDQPLFIQFTNQEQICPEGNCITAPSGTPEQNWGILNVSSVFTGLNNDQLFLPNTQNLIWSSVVLNNVPVFPGEITGIFYGIQAVRTESGIASQGGFLELYYDVNRDYSSNFDPTQRTADNVYTGATEGTLLAKIAFATGAIAPNASIVGDTVPSAAGFSGIADSFGDIVDVNADGVIDALDGVWAQYLDTDFFVTLLIPNSDFRFKNGYNYDPDWNGVAATNWANATWDGTQAIGADSTDPARAFAQPIPEPASMLLLGTGLAGLAGASRRRRKKNQA